MSADDDNDDCYLTIGLITDIQYADSEDSWGIYCYLLHFEIF
jgi:hypothetical protein